MDQFELNNVAAVLVLITGRMAVEIDVHSRALHLAEFGKFPPSPIEIILDLNHLQVLLNRRGSSTIFMIKIALKQLVIPKRVTLLRHHCPSIINNNLGLHLFATQVENCPVVIILFNFFSELEVALITLLFDNHSDSKWGVFVFEVLC